jgi:predicted DNA binding protein
MRKVTVTMNVKFFEKFLPKTAFEDINKVEYMDGKHIVKLDLLKGIKIVIVEMKFKNGYSLKDLNLPKNVQILDVFEQDGSKCTCMVKAVVDKHTKGLLRFFKKDVIYEPPFRYQNGKLVISFISDSKTIQTVLKAFQLFGAIEDIQVQRAIFTDTSPLAILTEKQKDAVLAAKRLGYYDIPRKAGTLRVAKELHLSKATALEHLRKAEKRLITHMLSGH